MGRLIAAPRACRMGGRRSRQRMGHAAQGQVQGFAPQIFQKTQQKQWEFQAAQVVQDVSFLVRVSSAEAAATFPRLMASPSPMSEAWTTWATWTIQRIQRFARIAPVGLALSPLDNRDRGGFAGQRGAGRIPSDQLQQ